MINVKDAELKDLKIITPQVFNDDRGYFLESWNHKTYSDVLIHNTFVQDNESLSVQGTLRGMHIQTTDPQGKLVRVIKGNVYDAVVDCRKNSPTFGQSFGLELSEKNKKQIWIPEGFAHGFLVLSEIAIFSYKCTRFYNPSSERTILWNDKDIDIRWPLDNINKIKLSQKDKSGLRFSDFKKLI